MAGGRNFWMRNVDLILVPHLVLELDLLEILDLVTELELVKENTYYR